MKDNLSREKAPFEKAELSHGRPDCAIPTSTYLRKKKVEVVARRTTVSLGMSNVRNGGGRKLQSFVVDEEMPSSSLCTDDVREPST